MTTTVDKPSIAVAKMSVPWGITEALIDGTPAMREAGEHLLPKWPKEDEESYKSRRSVATLYPAYARTIRVMAGKPFSKPLTIKDASPRVQEWCQDIDRQGVSLNVFAAEMFEEALAHGMAGILVDAPKQLVGPARSATQAEQSAAGVRPYFVRVKHRQILGWRVQMTSHGPQLSQLRLKECTAEPDGQFGDKEVQRVRVLTPGAYQVWRKQEDGEWGLEDEGTTDLKVIPFVPLYGLRKDLMVGMPPLLDLAYLNVKHFQSESDQDNILHVARVPILYASGVDDGFALTVGAAAAVRLPQGAELKYAEHTGKAIEAGRQSLLDLEARMIATGAELLVAKPGVRTAEESSNDAEANKSDLQRIGEVFEDSIDQALALLAEMGGEADTATVSLFKDYAARSLSEASATLIHQMGQAGSITKATMIRELQRRGTLSDGVDPEKEPQLAQEEIGPQTPTGNAPPPP